MVLFPNMVITFSIDIIGYVYEMLAAFPNRKIPIAVLIFVHIGFFALMG